MLRPLLLSGLLAAKHRTCDPFTAHFIGLSSLKRSKKLSQLLVKVTYIAISKMNFMSELKINIEFSHVSGVIATPIPTRYMYK